MMSIQRVCVCVFMTRSETHVHTKRMYGMYDLIWNKYRGCVSGPTTQHTRRKQHQLYESFESMTRRDLHPSPSALHLFTKHSGTLHTIDRNHRPRMYGQMAHACARAHSRVTHAYITIATCPDPYQRSTLRTKHATEKKHTCARTCAKTKHAHTKVMYVRTPTWRDCVVIY